MLEGAYKAFCVLPVIREEVAWQLVDQGHGYTIWGSTDNTGIQLKTRKNRSMCQKIDILIDATF